MASLLPHLTCTSSSLPRVAESNSHPGNVWFRARVEERKAAYRVSTNATKRRVAHEVVRLVRNRAPPGRFLVRDMASGLWNDVGDAEACKKAKQALREPPRREAGDEAAAGTADPPVAVRENRKRHVYR